MRRGTVARTDIQRSLRADQRREVQTLTAYVIHRVHDAPARSPQGAGGSTAKVGPFRGRAAKVLADPDTYWNEALGALGFGQNFRRAVPREILARISGV